MKRRTIDDFNKDMRAKAATVKYQIEHTDHGIIDPAKYQTEKWTAKMGRSTPGDTDRKQRIAANACDALRRLKSNQSYEDWRMVGHQLMVITEEVMNELALDEWDGDNKGLVHECTRRFEAWEYSVSKGDDNKKPLSKQERWALREIMTDPKYHAFYTTELTGPEQRRVNHPNAIINRYKAKHPDPNKPKKSQKASSVLSPGLTAKNKRIEELEAHETELKEELEAAREVGLTDVDQAVDVIVAHCRELPRAEQLAVIVRITDALGIATTQKDLTRKRKKVKKEEADDALAKVGNRIAGAINKLL